MADGYYVNDRIKQLRKELKLSQTEFGKKLGVTRAVILNIELQKVEPKQILIDHICNLLDVNKTWLLNGEGDTFGNKTSKINVDEIKNLFENLEPIFQDYILNQIKGLLEIQEQLSKSAD